MPMFARRRLQAMLDEAAEFLGSEKRSDLVARLEANKPDQVLSAEGELSLIWAISRLGPVELEPNSWGARHPDILSGMLFRDQEAAIEIKCVSNGPIAGYGAMRRAAEKMANYANKVRSGVGKFFHFQFAEESHYSASGYRRRRKVALDFDLDDEARAIISRLAKSNYEAQERLSNAKIDVVIGRSASAILGRNYFCSMPPEFHSLESNPVFDALSDAKRQLRNEGFRGKKVIVLFDAGCILLSNLNDFDGSQRRVSGRQVILHFLSRIHRTPDEGVEVAVLSASTKGPSSNSRFNWKLTVFDGARRILREGHPLHAAIERLPPPQIEGYRARQLLEDGIFRTPKFRAFAASVATSYHYSKESKQLKLSSRLLIEFLSGNISEKELRYGLGSKDEFPLSGLLRSGLMPHNVKLEAGGMDKDDDHIVFEFKSDPSVSPLK